MHTNSYAGPRLIDIMQTQITDCDARIEELWGELTHLKDDTPGDIELHCKLLSSIKWSRITGTNVQMH